MAEQQLKLMSSFNPNIRPSVTIISTDDTLLGFSHNWQAFTALQLHKNVPNFYTLNFHFKKKTMFH